MVKIFPAGELNGRFFRRKQPPEDARPQQAVEDRRTDAAEHCAAVAGTASSMRPVIWRLGISSPMGR